MLIVDVVMRVAKYFSSKFPLTIVVLVRRHAE